MIDYRDSPEEAKFRADLTAWVKEALPHLNLPQNVDERDHAEAPWHRMLYKAGWVGLSWPVEYGGKGLSPTYDAILNDVLGEAGALPPPAIGFLGRALQIYGTEEQRFRFLPGLLSGEIQWCQGFSEPDAGSDLASLRTRAVRTGDHYVVNGQKVWTSRAAWADWCLLLVRTEIEAPKHAGISCLAVDMRAPGIEVRALQQATGSKRFAEVFFRDVEVPVAQRIGPEGGGWKLAMTTVKYERGPADTGMASRYLLALRRLENLRREGILAPETARDLGHLYVQIEVLRLHILMDLLSREAHEGTGPETSVDKLLAIRTEQQLGQTALKLMTASICRGENADWLYDYLRSRAASIYGGTEQIQKNLVATRIVGLPR